MEDFWEFRISFGFPVPNWPFAVVTFHGRLNPRPRKESFTINSSLLAQRTASALGVIACHCSNILEDELL